MIKSVFYGVMLDINPLKDHPERIENTDRDLASNLNYDKNNFPVEEKDFEKIEVQNNNSVNKFFMKMRWFFQFMFDKNVEDSMDLLLLINDDQSHYMYIKDFNTFMFHKTKIKIKTGSVKVAYSVLVVKIFC